VVARAALKAVEVVRGALEEAAVVLAILVAAEEVETAGAVAASPAAEVAGNHIARAPKCANNFFPRPEGAPPSEFGPSFLVG
jgi:hypothetical protein